MEYNLSRRAKSGSGVQENMRTLWQPKFHYHTLKILTPILSYANIVHTPILLFPSQSPVCKFVKC